MSRRERNRRNRESRDGKDRQRRPRTRSGPLCQRLGDFFPLREIVIEPDTPEPAAAEPIERPAPRSKVPEGWWEEAFANHPTPSERRGHRCGEKNMLTIVAYDITENRRLRKIATICEDYGVRVQYSVFECRLEADRFDAFWADLLATIDPETDRIVAYKVCTACAKDIRDAGIQTHQEKVVAYVF
jgi:CRISPR-associated protein Cas2